MTKEDKKRRVKALLEEIEYEHENNPRSERSKKGARRLLAALFGKKKETKSDS